MVLVAVDVASTVNHTIQESVCTALLVSKLLKRLEAELRASAFPGRESWDRRDTDHRVDTYQVPLDAFSQEPVHCQHSYCQGLEQTEAPMTSSH